MADNTILNQGSGGDTVRTEDVGGGVKIMVGKTHTGAAGTDGGPVTISNPFPVVLASGTDAGAMGTAANPLKTTAQSGSVYGQLVGGQPAGITNPLPVIMVSGSNPIGTTTNPFTISGSLTVGSQSVITNNLKRAIVPATIIATNILSASASSNRTRATIFNHGAASLYLVFGSGTITPTLNIFDVKLASGSYYELPSQPIWQDSVQGIWDAANGFAMINDYTGSI